MTGEKKDVPLSGNDLIEMMKDMKERANIMYDSEVKSTDTIEDLMKNRGHVMFFHDWGTDCGHWVCMVRHSQTGECYYFDSTGKKPHFQEIVDVVLKTYPKLEYNDVVFQQSGTNWCGRICLLVICLNKLGFEPQEIENFIVSLGDGLDEFLVETIKK